ncbi:MAG TPA: ferrochelatase [Steroidobacteraceae bacterium]
MAGATIAALIVNTGTPQAPRSPAVRRFLRRFLSDRRVIELPRLLWWPLLHLVVLPLRAPRSARRYRQIWREEGSPLLFHTTRLREALARELGSERGSFRVEQAFLYSQPSVAEALERLCQDGIRRMIVLPLYPQSSGSTTGAVFDAVGAGLRAWRAVPELRVIAGYPTDRGYIAALARSLEDHWLLHGRAQHLLMSFHGIPQSYVTRGDRYAADCEATAAHLAATLDLQPQAWSLSYQSRFGANRWLAPATDRTLADLPRRGVRSVSVVCPGFAADCLETLEEIALLGREIFLSAGGERFDYVSALNARADHAGALAGLILRATADWDAPERPAAGA